MTEKVINKIAEVILNSKGMTALTGAGISTESGISDFRSPGGIWSRFDPDVFTNDMLYRDPENFYRKGLALLEYLEQIDKSKPNKAHKVLADLEKNDYLEGIVTQNIDGLHQKAGSKKVIEIHGNLTKCHCLGCGGSSRLTELVEKVREGQVPPRCDRCNGVLRPSIILFGDRLPDCFQEAIRLVQKSEILLVIGSSLEISPANTLLDHSDNIIIINRQQTMMDSMASLVLHMSASEALTRISERILN